MKEKRRNEESSKGEKKEGLRKAEKVTKKREGNEARRRAWKISNSDSS